MGAKRFTIKYSILNDGYVIIDNEKEYTFPILHSTLNYMFYKALNGLHEENVSLKEENKFLQSKVMTYKKVNSMLKEQIE